MSSVKQEPCKRNFNEIGETPNEVPPINPNNGSNEMD